MSNNSEIAEKVLFSFLERLVQSLNNTEYDSFPLKARIKYLLFQYEDF